MHIAVGHPVGPLEVVDVIDLLQIHRDAFSPVCDFAGNRIERNAADFLKIRKLGDLHAVETHFPPQTPGTERRRLPIVLHKPDVVFLRIDAQLLEAFQIEALNIVGRRFQHDLVLVVVLHAVGIFPVPAISWTAAGLRIRSTPGFRPEGTEERSGMECARAHFQIIGLVDDTPAVGPKTMQGENEVLEIHRMSRSSRWLLVVTVEKQA